MNKTIYSRNYYDHPFKLFLRAHPEPVGGYPRALEEILQPAFAKALAGAASSQGRCSLLSLTKYQDERRKIYKLGQINDSCYKELKNGLV